MISNLKEKPMKINKKTIACLAAIIFLCGGCKTIQGWLEKETCETLSAKADGLATVIYSAVEDDEETLKKIELYKNLALNLGEMGCDIVLPAVTEQNGPEPAPEPAEG